MTSRIPARLAPTHRLAGRFALIYAALAVFFSGCLQAAMAPAVMMASANARSTSSAAAASDPPPDKEEQAQRCEQLLHAPPSVEEVRRGRDGSFESREVRLELLGDNARWVVYRQKGSSPQGWRPQQDLARLRFVPPLREKLTPNQQRYLVYAASVAANPGESEQMISVAEDFGPRSGSFKWQDRIYNYTLVEKLPCFPGPDD